MVLVTNLTIEEEKMNAEEKELSELTRTVIRLRRLKNEKLAKRRQKKILRISVIALILSLIGLALFFSYEAHAQTRLTVSEGWPVVMDGGEWDQMGSTFRLGVKTSLKLNDVWSVGVELQALTPLTVPHPNPQMIISAAFRINDKLSFDTGLGYMIVCPYNDKPIRQFLGLSFGVSFPITEEITFAFMIGPGATFTFVVNAITVNLVAKYYREKGYLK